MRGSVWFIACLLLLGVMSNTSAQEQIYKWVDDNGVTHFSARKPEGVEAERTAIRVHQNQRTTVARSPSQSSLNEARQTRRDQDKQAAADEAERAAREAEIRAENCKKSRERLETYNNSRRLYRVREDGERDYLSDQELDQERAGAIDAVKEWCD